MPLELKIGILNNDDGIIVADATGDYNAVTNPTGWGSPNAARTTPSPVSALSLDVYLPGTSVSIGGANLLATSLFASVDRAYDIYEDTSSVVPAFSLQDGVWKYEVTFTISTVPTTETVYSLRTNELDCKVAKLALGNMDDNDFVDIKAAYDKMQNAFACGEYVLAQQLYEQVVDMLTDCSPYSSGCNC
jgi:hypothetical protein